MSEVLERINEVLYEYENFVQKQHSDINIYFKMSDKLYWALIAAQGELVCAEKEHKCACKPSCKSSNS